MVSRINPARKGLQRYWGGLEAGGGSAMVVEQEAQLLINIVQTTSFIASEHTTETNDQVPPILWKKALVSSKFKLTN